MCQFVQSVFGLMAWLCRSQLNSRLRWQSVKTAVDLQLQPWLGTRNCVACAAFDRTIAELTHHPDTWVVTRVPIIHHGC